MKSSGLISGNGKKLRKPNYHPVLQKRAKWRIMNTQFLFNSELERARNYQLETKILKLQFPDRASFPQIQIKQLCNILYLKLFFLATDFG